MWRNYPVFKIKPGYTINCFVFLIKVNKIMISSFKVKLLEL